MFVQCNSVLCTQDETQDDDEDILLDIVVLQAHSFNVTLTRSSHDLAY